MPIRPDSTGDRDARAAAEREAAGQAGQGAPGGRARRRGRARWYARPLARAGFVSMLAVGTVVMVTPASGAAGAIATGFVRAIRHLAADSRDGRSFAGTAAVGALFTTSDGQLDKHFCSGTVINSPNGDLVITAAHCITGTSGPIDFVPGYDNGRAPYGSWTVTKVYVDQAWSASQSPDDDFAILQVRQVGLTTPIEDVTGADQLATGEPADGTTVQVIGYPDASGQPITCRNRIFEPMAGQLGFNCGGYTDGTSGGPFLAAVNGTTGQGTVVGVIGGYEQGGDTPQVSYAAVFGANLQALYQTAVAGG